MILIYPDTNIWSYLAQQAVDEEQLVAALRSKNANLVLSAHAVYELAKSFTGKAGSAVAVQLFSSLKRFLDLDICCSKELKDFVKEECYAYENQLPQIDPMLDSGGCDIIKAEVEKLANGLVGDEVKQFIEKRIQDAATERADQRDHFAGRNQLKQKLLRVPESDLPNWLQTETTTPDGIQIFHEQLTHILGQEPPPGYARAVLMSLPSHAARALVRTNLYSNWRAANRGSNPRDLIDDMLHILYAIYSDLYVTGESGQQEYASLLLTSRTKVAIYDVKSGVPVDQRLLSLL
jgi:hypothetical protein